MNHPDPEISLKKACAYLWSKQGDDGGWHSETHGILKSGESLTPFILVALLKVPASMYQPAQESVEKAIDFIRRNITAKLSVDSIPQILDYPNYTAAYALKVLVSHDDIRDTALIHYLKMYLCEQQFDEDRGIDSLHPAYGGWGFGERGLKPGKVGHVDLSHTRRVCEALRMVLSPTDPVFEKAQKYLMKVQNTFIPDSMQEEYLDGGFFTSIVIPETNKSLRVKDVPDRWYSYATATCDGLLALHAAGVDHADLRFEQAAEWLNTHTEWRYPEGIPHDDPLQWHLAMKYYHLAVRAEVCKVISCDADVLTRMGDILWKEQRKDGSFVNLKGAPNKEDDPLLATAFTIIALY